VDRPSQACGDGNLRSEVKNLRSPIHRTQEHKWIANVGRLDLHPFAVRLAQLPKVSLHAGTREVIKQKNETNGGACGSFDSGTRVLSTRLRLR